jgi:hypothetical protein
MKLEICPEICCDLCYGVIHNHFHCPSCDNIDASTNLYHDINEEPVGFILKCDECGAKFVLISKGEDKWDRDNWEWEQIKEARS